MTDWRERLIEDDAAIRALLVATHRIAVLGIKTEAQADQPSYYVPQYLVGVGYQVIPVPVYFPETNQILGQPVYRRLVDIPEPVDLVNVFRRSGDLVGHLDDLIAAAPKAVWLQLGIRNDEVAEWLARAGIAVIQDRCLMVEHRRLLGSAAPL